MALDSAKSSKSHTPSSMRRSEPRSSPGSGLTKTKPQSPNRLSDNYEHRVSGREDWWRSTIKETPVPGAYNLDESIKVLEKKPNSYGFKSDGRRLDPQPYIGKGRLLMPGAYKHEDLYSSLEKSRATYGFRNSSRTAGDVLNFGKKDKDVNVSPDAYIVENHLAIFPDGDSLPHWTFKSKSQRFPTIQFVPKEGPGPGNYNNKYSEGNSIMSSSFLSKTPRFASSHNKVPGPGTYGRSYPVMTVTNTKEGRNNGIFFSPWFKA